MGPKVNKWEGRWENGRCTHQTGPNGPCIFSAGTTVNGWALACWCLKIITQHHMEETLPHFTQICLHNTHSQILILFSGDIFPISQKQVFSNSDCLSYAQKSLSPQSPSWTRPGQLFTSELWNHINHPTSQVITHPLWDCLLSEIKGPLPGNPLHRSLREFRLSE